MRTFGLLLVSLSLGITIQGQVPTASGAPPKKPTAPVRASTPLPVESKLVAPQVVTVLHRLNGLKLFRLMARKDQRLLAITQLDEAFKIMGDVHTNVIAGLALNDGETIVARLPEVEAELGSVWVPDSANYFASPSAIPPTIAPEAPRPTSPPAAARPFARFDEPDVTVIARDGRRFLARYVGLDGATGLSVLKLTVKNQLLPIAKKIEEINVGQHLRLFGPEPVSSAAVGGVVSVRVGETDGTITNVVQARSGGVFKMKFRSARLTPANIGGIAVDDAGETVGIVDSIEKGEANLLSTAQIKNAAQRVLARQASVPRPWLGVSGEPVATLAQESLLSTGWLEPQALALTQDRCGILLTSVAPNSPAAVAALRSGDVILRVNGEDVRTAEDFSWFLGQAGPGGSVSFTVMRPGHDATETVNLKLSSSFTVGFPAKVTRGNRTFFKDGLLIKKGIETLALKPAVAARWGADAGLLVIYVEPETEAFRAGLRAGDLIEAINGHQASMDRSSLFDDSKADLILDVLRGKQKIKFTIAASPINE